ncbi:MAG: hypothetical protein Q4D29_08455 [Lachnospiraceae bacterium]|nr:hypothetical protein [Lachnospiraceae bacterium]
MKKTNFSKLFNYIVLLTVLITMLMLTGCGYTKEEKAMMKKYEDVAKKNAVNYVNEKYGFKAKITGTRVLKVDPGPVPDFFPSPTGMIDVSMTHDGIDFIVNITGEDVSTDGKDDYQKTEIEEAFAKRISKETGLNIDKLGAKYKKDCRLKDKFTDIDSFLENLRAGGAKVVISISAETLDGISENNLKSLNYDGMELLIMSCRNETAEEIISNSKYFSTHQYDQNFYNVNSMDNKLFEYSLFMNGYAYMSSNKDVYCKKYEMKKVIEDVYYSYEDQNGVNPIVTITKDMAPANDWSRASGKAKELPTFENPVRIGESYAVDFDGAPRVQVFIKQEKKDKDDKAERYVALQYIDEDGNEVFTHIHPTKIEGAYSFCIENQKDMRFSIMINRK